MAAASIEGGGSGAGMGRAGQGGGRTAGSRWTDASAGGRFGGRDGGVSLLGFLKAGGSGDGDGVIGGGRGRRRAKAFDRTAYEDAPRIRQGGDRLRFALTPGAAYGLVGGAAMAALLLFIAGFMAAFWFFAPESPFVRAQGTTVAEGEGAAVAIPAPRPASARPVDPGGALIADAIAGDAPESPAPPSPEIAAVEAMRADPAQTDQIAALPETTAPPPAEAEAAPTPSESADTPRGRLKPEGTEARSVITPPPPPASETGAGTGAERTAAATPADTGPYRLQFGAFRERANADELLAKIPERYGARIVTAPDSQGQPLHYVRSVGYASLAEARAAGRAVEQSAGLKSFVRRAPGGDRTG